MNTIVSKSSKGIKNFLNQSFFNNNSFRNYLEPILETYIPNHSLLHIKAKVVNKSMERGDVVNIILKPHKNWNGFRAGQFVQIGITINGILYQRIFSISSSAEWFQKEGLIRLSIQRQELGRVTPFIFDSLKIGSFVQVSHAMGDFTPIRDYLPNSLFIAGGVGITPIMSILSSHANTNSSIVLLYYASNAKPHLFVKELLDLANLNSNFQIHLLDSRSDGYFSKKHLQLYCNDFNTRKIYLCGPQAFDKMVCGELDFLNVKKSNIISESFTAQDLSNNDTETKEIEINIINKGRVFNVNNDKTLLELLEHQNEQPKFGCRMGICNQCICKKIDGLVYNIQTKNVSDSGVEYIKICSTIPMGNIKLVI